MFGLKIGINCSLLTYFQVSTTTPGFTPAPTTPIPPSSGPGIDVDLTGCGRSKSCFREPADCALEECSHVITWKKVDEDIVEFELSVSVTGEQSYTAIGFSPTQDMVRKK